MKGNILSSCGISGKECCASLELLDVASKTGGGICWFYREKNPNDFKIIYENRTTVLLHSSGKKIIGAEHLSAASLAFSNCEFALHAPQGELPLLDGSAKLWIDELKYIAKKNEIKKMNFYDVPKNKFEVNMEERYLVFTACDKLEIEYTINRFGHEFTANVKIENASDLEKILNARTFIFEEELQTVKLSENLKDCGLLLKNNEKNDLRFENEPAYHKILDFLGDITIYSNTLPRGKFIIFNGGHELHHKTFKFYLTPNAQKEVPHRFKQ